MVTRDTVVHLVALVIGVALLFGAAALDVVPDTETATIAVLVLFYGLALGGAHLYLALRRDDGMVPARARWRYLTMLAVLLVTGAVIGVAGEAAVLGVDVSSFGLVVIVATLLVYLYMESRAGLRSTRAAN